MSHVIWVHVSHLKKRFFKKISFKKFIFPIIPKRTYHPPPLPLKKCTVVDHPLLFTVTIPTYLFTSQTHFSYFYSDFFPCNFSLWWWYNIVFKKFCDTTRAILKYKNNCIILVKSICILLDCQKTNLSLSPSISLLLSFSLSDLDWMKKGWSWIWTGCCIFWNRTQSPGQSLSKRRFKFIPHFLYFLEQFSLFFFSKITN